MIKGNRDKERIVAETWPEPVPVITPEMRFRSLHHITAITAKIDATHEFLHGALGLRRVKRTSNFDMPDSFHWYWGVGTGAPGTVVTYFERPDQAHVVPGPGQTHHYALAVNDTADLELWRTRLLASRWPASPIHDHEHFTSFFTRDPDGQPVELATISPGFVRMKAEEVPQ
jgi:glyoxalase family protein